MYQFTTDPSETRAGPAIEAVLLFNPMLGSLYAWSVFLAPLEAELGIPRSEISTVFSVAIFRANSRPGLRTIGERSGPDPTATGRRNYPMWEWTTLIRRCGHRNDA